MALEKSCKQNALRSHVSPELKAALQLHQSGRAADALPLYAQVLAAEQDNAAALFYGGVAAWTAGDAALALARLNRLMATTSPAVAEAHYHRALALTSLGREQEAIVDYEAAVRLKPGLIAAHNNLGELQRKRRNFAGADESFAAALQIDPSHVDARFNRALNAMQSGEMLHARTLLNECIKRNPDHANARSTLVDVLNDLGERTAALTLARASCKRLPAHALLWNALGQMEQAAGNISEAQSAFEAGLTRAPDSTVIAMNLALLQSENADIDGAQRTYESALALHDHPGLRFRLATLLPSIPASEVQISAARAQFSARLSDLRAANLRLDDPLNDFGDTPFYLSYHGRDDDRALLADLAATLHTAAPALTFTAEHLDRPRNAGKPRLGICSHFLFDQSVGRALHAVIAGLPRDEFDVHLFLVPPFFDDALAQTIATGTTVHRLPFDLIAARDRIATAELDWLLYPEIGMEALTYYLAHARLARSQWSTLGHPCTSGLTSIDKYVSYAALEPEDSERFYSEALLRLPESSPFPAYPSAPLPAKMRDRQALGFSGDGEMLICPQSLFKLMPRFDATLAAILDAAPKASLLLPEATLPGQTAAIKARFATTLGTAAKRVHFFRRRPRGEFVELIAASDVLLDPFPVGGGITTWDALATGTPIVTLPGQHLRSRFASAALAAAGIVSTVATSEADYAAIADRLLQNADERHVLRRKLATAAPAIYADQRAVVHWLAAIRECVSH